jgi:hypothetical protein
MPAPSRQLSKNQEVMAQESVFSVAASHQQAARIDDQLGTAHVAGSHVSLLYPSSDTSHDSARVLLSVSTGTSEEASRAKAIFIVAGAGDIRTSGEAALPGTVEHAAPMHAEPSSVRHNRPA